MSLNFTNRREALDFLLEAMPFAGEARLEIEATNYARDVTGESSGSYDFVYRFYLSQKKNTPDITFSERIPLDREEKDKEVAQDRRHKAMEKELALRGLSRICFTTIFSYEYSHDPSFIKKNLVASLPSYFYFEELKKIAAILGVKERKIMNYVSRKAGEDVNLSNYVFLRDRVVELFSSPRGESRRESPLVYAAMSRYKKQKQEQRKQ